VVFGMPRVAAQIGAVQTQLPVGAIGDAILDHRAVRS
jgi:chemotaxis response regulator CheB